MKWMLLLSFLIHIPFSFAADQNNHLIDDAGLKVNWGYRGSKGPERWSQLSKDFETCATGKTQSPINIKKKVITSDHSLAFHYKKAPLELMDNGPTSLIIGNKKTIINDGHGLQVNFPTNTNEEISYKGEKYRLVQFHFHSPSENQLRRQGFPLEIHFVHQGAHGNILVIGVWVKGGKANKMIEKIINNKPPSEGVPFTPENVSINPIRLIPKHKSYYSFMGSLTTPPCTEGLQWIMLDNPLTASPAQIVSIRKASHGGNARSVQKHNKRDIYYAE